MVHPKFDTTQRINKKNVQMEFFSLGVTISLPLLVDCALAVQKKGSQKRSLCTFNGVKLEVNIYYTYTNNILLHSELLTTSASSYYAIESIYGS